MTVQLTLPEKVVYECAATGESTYEFFSRCYKKVEGKENIELVIYYVKSWIKHGIVPDCVRYYFQYLP
jgi:hypothetical protein